MLKKIFYFAVFSQIACRCVEYPTLLQVGVGSEGSCFHGSTQELAQTRWITNNFNHEETSTLPPSCECVLVLSQFHNALRS